MSEAWAADTLFFRQVHPNHLSEGKPNSQAFVPFPKDKDKLSVDDSQPVSAKDAHRHFTQVLRFESAGTWGVNLDEINHLGDLLVEASPVEDSENPDRSNPAHCHINFESVTSKGQKRRRAQALAIHAGIRGFLYAPNVE